MSDRCKLFRPKSLCQSLDIIEVYHKYHTQEPIDLSDEEPQVRSQRQFIMQQEQGQGQGQDMNTAILATLTQLLKNQENQRGPMLRPKLREPDTYHGTRTAHAAESWLRSVQRYADVTGVMISITEMYNQIRVIEIDIYS